MSNDVGELEGNESEGNELEGNELEGNEPESNQPEGNQFEGNEQQNIMADELLKEGNAKKNAMDEESSMMGMGQNETLDVMNPMGGDTLDKKMLNVLDEKEEKKENQEQKNPAPAMKKDDEEKKDTGKGVDDFEGMKESITKAHELGRSYSPINLDKREQQLSDLLKKPGKFVGEGLMQTGEKIADFAKKAKNMFSDPKPTQKNPEEEMGNLLSNLQQSASQGGASGNAANNQSGMGNAAKSGLQNEEALQMATKVAPMVI